MILLMVGGPHLLGLIVDDPLLTSHFIAFLKSV